MAFSIVTKLCNYRRYVIAEHFHHPKENTTHISHHIFPTISPAPIPLVCTLCLYGHFTKIGSCNMWPLKFNRYFEIIVNSHDIMRNNTGKSYPSLTQSPPMVSSCFTVEHQNQNTDVDSSHLPYSDFLSFTCVCASARLCI